MRPGRDSFFTIQFKKNITTPDERKSACCRKRETPQASGRKRTGAHMLTKKCAAEFIGTFWLVFGGCGAAIFAAAFPNVGIGFIGVAFAFGLTVLTMVYAVGHISGCHLN